MEEKITIPVYCDRVSPLFDIAGLFVVFKIAESTIMEKSYINTLKCTGVDKVEKLYNIGSKTIICSAMVRYVLEL